MSLWYLDRKVLCGKQNIVIIDPSYESMSEHNAPM